MCTKCDELTTFLSINFFDVAHASGVGESLFGPVNLRVDGVQHVSLDGCVELNVAYDVWLLVLVDELGLCDVLCLWPVHSRFTIIVCPVKNRQPYLWVFTHVWVMTCNREICIQSSGTPIRL